MGFRCDQLLVFVLYVFCITPSLNSCVQPQKKNPKQSKPQFWGNSNTLERKDDYKYFYQNQQLLDSFYAGFCIKWLSILRRSPW